MHVQQGEIYGFLGLNGAGKTSMIRLLLGLIKPDEGSCQLFGQNPKQAPDIWNDIGYLIETPHAYPNLSVVENLQVICKLRGIKNSAAIDRIIHQLQLRSYKDKKEEHLSLGNKQRLGLAKALIHQGRLIKEVESSQLDSQIIKKLHISTSDNTKAVSLLNTKGYEAKLIKDKIKLSNQDAMDHPEVITTFLMEHHLPPSLLYVFKEDLEQYFLRVIHEQP